MGMNASVRCRCFEEGKLKPFRLMEQVYLDEDNCVNLREENGQRWGLDILMEFDAWADSACDHENMWLASVHIGNWSGYRMFQSALEQAGGVDKFPNLIKQLPNSNGGLTSSHNAQKCLNELNNFCSTPNFGKLIRLNNLESGKIIFSRVPSHDGIFVMFGTHNIDFSLSSDGYFKITCRDPYQSKEEYLFRSRIFSQERLDTNRFNFYDKESGTSFESPVGISYEIEPAKSIGELRVTISSDKPANHNYAVSALKTVFSASINSGNPVQWG